MSGTDAGQVKGGIAGLAHECHEGITKRGDFQPCEKPAVAARIDPDGDEPYPVCAKHARGRMVLLSDLLATESVTGSGNTPSAEPDGEACRCGHATCPGVWSGECPVKPFEAALDVPAQDGAEVEADFPASADFKRYPDRERIGFARSVVNQLFEESGLSVERRQRINDRSDETVYELLAQRDKDRDAAAAEQIAQAIEAHDVELKAMAGHLGIWSDLNQARSGGSLDAAAIARDATPAGDERE